jgi:hypothetical protein
LAGQGELDAPQPSGGIVLGGSVVTTHQVRGTVITARPVVRPPRRPAGVARPRAPRARSRAATTRARGPDDRPRPRLADRAGAAA